MARELDSVFSTKIIRKAGGRANRWTNAEIDSI